MLRSYEPQIINECLGTNMPHNVCKIRGVLTHPPPLQGTGSSLRTAFETPDGVGFEPSPSGVIQKKEHELPLNKKRPSS